MRADFDRAAIAEPARLGAMHDLAVLDTAPEAEFHDIVRAVSVLCGTPIAAFSLVDRDRQWFKPRVGRLAA